MKLKNVENKVLKKLYAGDKSKTGERIWFSLFSTKKDR
jgi:hypothetical protein